MRMWMVNPEILCRKHLLGEHVETHMFVGTIQSGVRLKGYTEGNLLEIGSLAERHDALVEEMERRGYSHNSPLPSFATTGIKDVLIDQQAALQDLLKRCPDCRSRYERWLENRIRLKKRFLTNPMRSTIM